MNQTDLAACMKSGWLAALDMANDRQGLRNAMQNQHSALDVWHLSSMAIVGAASEGQRLARICQEQKIAIEAIVDDSPVRRGSAVVGITVEAVMRWLVCRSPRRSSSPRIACCASQKGFAISVLIPWFHLRCCRCWLPRFSCRICFMMDCWTIC